MPKVYNKKSNNAPTGSIYIGRPTKWGNPFTHITNGTLAKFVVKNREEAVKSYEKWLLSQPDLMESAKKELKGKDLVCWCAPEACHGDVLLKVANS